VLLTIFAHWLTVKIYYAVGVMRERWRVRK